MGSLKIITLLVLCCVLDVLSRDIVLDRDDERIQRYLKHYRRTSSRRRENEINEVQTPRPIPYRGRYTGGTYSQTTTRYSTHAGRSDNRAHRIAEMERERMHRERMEKERQRETERTAEEERQKEEKERSKQEILQRQRRQHSSRQHRLEQQRIEKERLEEQQRIEQERLQELERQRQVKLQRIEQERAENERREQAERERRDQVERERAERNRREQAERERQKRQEEYERRLQKQQEDYERQLEERKRREEAEALRQQQERERIEREHERLRQEQEQGRRQELESRHQSSHGRSDDYPRSLDLHSIRASLRSELQSIVEEMRNQYESTTEGQNMIRQLSRQMENLLSQVEQKISQEPESKSRDVSQQLEHWMRRLEDMARDDNLNCQTAQRSIAELKNKMDYVERLVMHHSGGHSHGSQNRRSTTPRPPTDQVVNRDPPEIIILRKPEEIYDNRQPSGYNRGSRREYEVDKWLPATRERYNTRMAAEKARQRHQETRKQESMQRANELVRHITSQSSHQRPWSRKNRRPANGITGLLDPQVIDTAEKDSNYGPDSRSDFQEQTGPETLVIDYPGHTGPSSKARTISQSKTYTQPRRKSSRHRSRQVKNIRVYHKPIAITDRTPTNSEQQHVVVSGHQEHHDPEIGVVKYIVPPLPQSSSRTLDNLSGNCPGYVSGFVNAETVRKDTVIAVGSWMKDTLLRDERVWAIEESNVLYWSTLMEYPSEQHFINKNSAKIHRLPEACTGLGSVIHDGYLYCQLFAQLKDKETSILKIRLHDNVLVAKATIPGRNIGTRGWAGTYMTIQLAADETGIWAVFSGYDKLMKIYKLDSNLKMVDEWNTGQMRDSLGPGFIMCGVYYALDSHYADHIAYMYDTTTSQGRRLRSHRLAMPFKDVASIHYNPRDRNLYMWSLERKTSQQPKGDDGPFRFIIRTKMHGITERLHVETSRSNTL